MARDYERNGRLLAVAVSQFELRLHAWCFMPNHSHLLLSSPLGNLSDAMKWYGACVTQTYNERHERVGPLNQGRFESRLVDSNAYFLELARYIVVNPVRAGLCRLPGGMAMVELRGDGRPVVCAGSSHRG